MRGDGANDAPALRQAQIGIAVSTATDVAKSAAGMVLIEPGLSGIVAAVKEGRVTFQRILTYTLNAIILAIGGIAMAPLPVAVVAGVLAGAAAFAVVLDAAKIPLFAHLRIT
jgi:H+-transporting ATPase